eukprot:7403055-Heterocapsa_arctica.AAC.1
MWRGAHTAAGSPGLSGSQASHGPALDGPRTSPPIANANALSVAPARGADRSAGSQPRSCLFEDTPGMLRLRVVGTSGLLRIVTISSQST